MENPPLTSPDPVSSSALWTYCREVKSSTLIYQVHESKNAKETILADRQKDKSGSPEVSPVITSAPYINSHSLFCVLYIAMTRFIEPPTANPGIRGPAQSPHSPWERTQK